MSRERKDRGPKGSPGDGRREAILDAAWSLFLEKGYDGVSVDEIIRVSGGSKSSLYQFFGSKEGVLKALSESFADGMMKEVDLPSPQGRVPEAGLKKTGVHLGRMALSPSAVSLARLAVCSAGSFPEAARLWFESGPGKVLRGMAEFLKRETDAGRLMVKDPERAARYFLGMILFADHMAMSVGADPPSDRDLEKTVDGAVRIFMAVYGAK